MATPTPPTYPTAVSNSIAPVAVRTINITTNTQLEQYCAGTDTTLGVGGTPSGGPKYGDWVLIATGDYSPAQTIPVNNATGTVAGTGGNNYVTFMSANYASLPALGTRVQPGDATNMPRFLVPNSSSGSSGLHGLFSFSDNAQYFHFVGLDITIASGAKGYGCLYLVSPTMSANGAGSSTQLSHFVINRCLLHGDATYGNTNPLIVAGSDFTITDNNIYDIFSPTIDGAENHGILIGSGTGPYLIKNNEIVADSCNVFIGDSSVENAGVFPHNILIQENYINKLEKWNRYSNIYSTGKATVSSDGLTVTLTGGGTVSSGWVGQYFCVLTGAAASSVEANAFPDGSQLIASVNTGANTLTLASAEPSHHSTSNLDYKITKWAGVVYPSSTMKNHIEIKYGYIVAVERNILDFTCRGNQWQSLSIPHASGVGITLGDYLVDSNIIRNVLQGFTMVSRPVSATGLNITVSTVDSSGGNVRINFTGGHGAATGDTVELTGLTGSCASANGVHTLTVTSSTAFTVPIAFTSWDSVKPAVQIFGAGTPATKIQISNNLFENLTALDSEYPPSPSIRTLAEINVTPDFTASVAGDGALSTTGSWGLDNFLMEHNTIVCPDTATGYHDGGIRFNSQGNGVTTYTFWKNANFYVRNNVWKQSSYSGSGHGIVELQQPTGTYDQGTTCLGDISDGTRSFAYNAFFNPAVGMGAATEYAQFSGTDDDTLAIVADDTNVGFTSYASGAVANYKLAALYSTGTCTVTNGSPTVTGFTALPTTIVKGTPFKNNANGVFYLVASRDSSTQVTLQANYAGSTNTGAFTLGFQGWSSDGADPGINTSSFSWYSAVLAGTPVSAGFRYLPIRWP